MIAEAVDFILHRLLKTQHHQKRNNGSGQPHSNAANGNFMNDARKTSALGIPYSFGNEIRKVQRIS
jgi:hypothetical protein